MTAWSDELREPEAAPKPARKARPFYWSVRRELWEHPALRIAPPAATGIGLVGFLFASFRLPDAVRTLAADVQGAQAAKSLNAIEMPYIVVALAALIIGMIVGFFYCLSALNGERRDRSIQFWKSLPVSDTTTVLAKAFVPTVALPAIVFASIVAAQLAMLLLATVVVLLNGLDPTVLWSHAPPSVMWIVIPYGLIVNALWLAPIHGWFLLISAWAKRMTFVWALAPWMGVALFERLAFNSSHVIRMMERRLMGGFAEAFSQHGAAKAPIDGVGDLDPLRILSNPELWTGLAAAAVFLVLAIRLRRTNEPI